MNVHVPENRLRAIRLQIPGHQTKIRQHAGSSQTVIAGTDILYKYS